MGTNVVRLAGGGGITSPASVAITPATLTGVSEVATSDAITIPPGTVAVIIRGLDVAAGANVAVSAFAVEGQVHDSATGWIANTNSLSIADDSSGMVGVFWRATSGGAAITISGNKNGTTLYYMVPLKAKKLRFKITRSTDATSAPLTPVCTYELISSF